MKYKTGYRDQKHIWNIGNWIKCHRAKKTCRDPLDIDESCATLSVGKHQHKENPNAKAQDCQTRNDPYPGTQ